MTSQDMKILIVISSILFLCVGFFLGAISIGAVLSNGISDAVINLITNSIVFIGVGAGAYLGLRQISLGVDQIAESTKQAKLDRTVGLISKVEAEYVAFDTDEWLSLIDEYGFLLPIDKIDTKTLESFISEAQKKSCYKDLVTLMNSVGEVFSGIELKVYESNYIFERMHQVFFDLWRYAWPLIVMQREKEKRMHADGQAFYMLDLQDYLINNDDIFVSLPIVK